ncbi:TGS domain-containing protein, partial [Candidatus Woesearchaeota archaeon]|nr:TGS domain-containing protein [Candidatus Woesearchaeota archaeon]
VPKDIVSLFARKLNAMPTSAEKGTGIEKIKEKIFSTLNFIRIYMKEVGKKADMDVPLIIKSPATVRSVCEKIHRDFVKKFKYARVWGRSAKFPGQKKSLDKEVVDGDIVEIHIK